MAGTGFDPLDIRSEMGHTEHAAGTGTTSATTPAVDSHLPLVITTEDPVPLEIIAPGEPGNAFDVENPPIIQVFDPPRPPVRRSKRQAGYNPDLTPGKRFQHKGQPSTRPSLIDPAETSGDDSADGDYELVARKRPAPRVIVVSSSSSSIQDDVDAPSNPVTSPTLSSQNPVDENEVEISLAQFMANLKNQKGKAPSTSTVHLSARNPTVSNQSKSASADEAISGGANDSDPMDVAPDVENTEDDIDLSAYDLATCYNPMFYTETAFSNWALYENREFVAERNVDVEAFYRYNLIEFLKSRGLLSTCSSVLPYCHKAILEFYGNITLSVGDPRSAKFGQVFVRNRVYNFTADVINAHYDTPAAAEGSPPDLGEVISVLTGGMVSKFPLHPHKVSAATLTSLYSVLHKIAIHNWTPTTNTTVVTKAQALVLFSVGNSTLNFGRLVFNTVLQYAAGGLKSSKLPFPSLIYGILVSQGFVKNITEPLSLPTDPLKIASALLHGKRKVDLPWSVSASVPPATDPTQPSSSTTAPTTATPSMSDYVKISVAGAQMVLDHALKKIEQAKADLAYYEDLAITIQALLAVGVFHGQKGGDEAGPSGTKDDTDTAG